VSLDATLASAKPKKPHNKPHEENQIADYETKGKSIFEKNYTSNMAARTAARTPKIIYAKNTLPCLEISTNLRYLFSNRKGD
jgi:hypothetical protein